MGEKLPNLVTLIRTAKSLRFRVPIHNIFCVTYEIS
jgi:hypothetical protein